MIEDMRRKNTQLKNLSENLEGLIIQSF